MWGWGANIEFYPRGEGAAHHVLDRSAPRHRESRHVQQHDDSAVTAPLGTPLGGPQAFDGTAAHAAAVRVHDQHHVLARALHQALQRRAKMRGVLSQVLCRRLRAHRRVACPRQSSHRDWEGRGKTYGFRLVACGRELRAHAVVSVGHYPCPGGEDNCWVCWCGGHAGSLDCGIIGLWDSGIVWDV